MRCLLAAWAVAGVFASAAGAQRGQTPPPPPRPDTTVVLRSVGSTLEFVPSRISAKHGLRVRVRFVNDGTLPHNIVFARSEDDLDAMIAAAYAAGTTGFVPKDLRDKMLVFSELVSPGQSVELDFVMPPPGEYPFICLYPGHANSMLGTLRSLR